MDTKTYAIATRAKTGFALIPANVATLQKTFADSRASFKAIPCDTCGRPTGAKPFRAILRGDLYGLDTTGTGEMVISNA